MGVKDSSGNEITSSSHIANFLIGLDSDCKNSENKYGAPLQEVLKHERGHNTQLMMLGFCKFNLFIAIPSAFIDNDDMTPWELSASILGNSILQNGASNSEIYEALSYLLYCLF